MWKAKTYPITAIFLNKFLMQFEQMFYKEIHFYQRVNNIFCTLLGSSNFEIFYCWWINIPV